MNDDFKKRYFPDSEDADNTVESTDEETAAKEAEAEENVAEEISSEEKELNDELEALRDTFQEKYDETVEEAANGPVIQELEEGTEEENEEDSEENEADYEKSAKPKKKKKGLKAVLIAVPLAVVLMLVGSLLAYVVISVKEPDFAAFVNHYSNAVNSDDFEDSISYYESALALAKDENSIISKFASHLALKEEAVVLTYENQGFAAAYSYMKSKMTEDEIASPTTPKFKKFVGIVEEINEFGLAAFAKVFENAKDATEVPEADVLSEGLSIPSELKTEAGEILSSIASGYIFNKAAKNITDSLTAVNYYGEAYSQLVSFGVDSHKLAENIAVALYDNGFVIEAATLISVAINPESEVVNEEFTRVKTALEVFSGYDVSVYDVAVEAKEAEKTQQADVVALIKEKADMPDSDAELLAGLVVYIFDAFKAEEEHNLTQAATVYATLTSVLQALDMADCSVTVKTAEIMFAAGNLNEVQSLVSALTDEITADATDEEKAVLDNIKEAFTALDAASAVFNPYYSEYYQGGAPIDFDKLETELNETFGADATDYEKGFMYYVLHVAAQLTEKEGRLAYLDSMKSYVPDMVFLYGYSYLDEYTRAGNLSAAKSQAEALLAVNIADEFANSVIAYCLRAEGDLDGSVEAALKGIELSGSSANCAKQLAVAYMLKGDFESAFGYVTSMYSNGMSIDSCDMILVFNHFYKGEDEAIRTELDALVSEVNQAYASYGVSSYADTTAIIEGTKTLEDVFMVGNYDLSDD